MLARPGTDCRPSLAVCNKKLNIIYKNDGLNEISHGTYDGVAWSGGNTINSDSDIKLKCSQSPSALEINDAVYVTYSNGTDHKLRQYQLNYCEGRQEPYWTGNETIESNSDIKPLSQAGFSAAVLKEKIVAVFANSVSSELIYITQAINSPVGEADRL